MASGSYPSLEKSLDKVRRTAEENYSRKPSGSYPSLEKVRRTAEENYSSGSYDPSLEKFRRTAAENYSRSPYAAYNRIFYWEMARKRVPMLEECRRRAEAAIARDPYDLQSPVRCAGVLLELSRFQNDLNSKQQIIQDAIEKLQKVLDDIPVRSDALYCLGHCHMMCAFLIPELDEAKVFFDKAAICFEKAYQGKPEHEPYKKALVAIKDTERHAEIHRRGFTLAMPLGPSAYTSTKQQQQQQGPKKSKSSGLKYYIFGCVILAVGIVAARVGVAKSNMPPAPR